MPTTPPFELFQRGDQELKAALSGNIGRVPVYAQMHGFIFTQLGISPAQFFTQPDILVHNSLKMQAEYELDVSNLTFDVYNIEAQGLGQTIIFSDFQSPEIDRSYPLIRSREDLHHLQTPDFERTGRFSFVVEILKLHAALTGVQPVLRFCAPFTLVAMLRGLQTLIEDIYTNPKFAHELFTRVTDDVLAPYLLYQKAKLPTATDACGADATASVPIVNLNLLQDWCAPYIRRLQAKTGLNVTVNNWTGESLLKNPIPMMDLKLDLSGGLILGQDPDVAILTPEYYKHYSKERNVPLILGVGAAFLSQANQAEIRRRVQHYVQVGSRGGKFALYLCNIDAETPPENLRAAVEAAHIVGPR
jgi:uroporphyrinogen-III decarboxylase